MDTFVAIHTKHLIRPGTHSLFVAIHTNHPIRLGTHLSLVTLLCIADFYAKTMLITNLGEEYSYR